MLFQLFNSVVEFLSVLDIGREKDLNIAYPVTDSRSRKKIRLVIALNYSPLRHDDMQPCIARIKSIIHMCVAACLCDFCQSMSIRTSISFLLRRIKVGITIY